MGSERDLGAEASDDEADDIRNTLKLGVILPPMNLATEYDWCRLTRPGVSFHVHRVPVPPEIGSDLRWDVPEIYEKEIAKVMDDSRLKEVVKDVAARVQPDRVVFPVTSETAWNGVAGATLLAQRMGDWANGRPVTLGIHAVQAALAVMGISRIALFTPYFPPLTERLANYFREAGITVVASASITVRDPQMLFRVPLDQISATIRNLDSPDVQAIVQGGAGMSTLCLINSVEEELGKPMVTTNTSSLWHALRSSGHRGRSHRAGRLWREF